MQRVPPQLGAEQSVREVWGVRNPCCIVAGLMIRGSTARTAGGPLRAEGGSQLATNKETGPQGPEFANNLKELECGLVPEGSSLRLSPPNTSISALCGSREPSHPVSDWSTEPWVNNGFVLSHEVCGNWLYGARKLICRVCLCLF